MHEPEDTPEARARVAGVVLRLNAVPARHVEDAIVAAASPFALDALQVLGAPKYSLLSGERMTS